jgi:hypothetical protein
MQYNIRILNLRHSVMVQFFFWNKNKFRTCQVCIFYSVRVTDMTVISIRVLYFNEDCLLNSDLRYMLLFYRCIMVIVRCRLVLSEGSN